MICLAHEITDRSKRGGNLSHLFDAKPGHKGDDFTDRQKAQRRSVWQTFGHGKTSTIRVSVDHSDSHSDHHHQDAYP